MYVVQKKNRRVVEKAAAYIHVQEYLIQIRKILRNIKFELS